MKKFIGILYSLSFVWAVFISYIILTNNKLNLETILCLVAPSSTPALITTVIVLLYKFRTNLGLSGRPGKLLIAGSISWIIGVVALYIIDENIFYGDIDIFLKYALIPFIAALIIVPLITWALKKPSDPERNVK